jgi:hypothetical protein
MICDKCVHKVVCKWKSIYNEQIKRINVSKLDQDFVLVESRCLHFKHNIDGFPVTQTDLIYGNEKAFKFFMTKLEESAKE